MDPDSKITNFVYKFKNYDNSIEEVSEDITIPFDGCPEEIVSNLMNKMDPMMRYLDADVRKSFGSSISPLDLSLNAFQL